MTIDNANNLNPECYVKRESSVKTWNLCSEIFLNTNEHSITLPEELKQKLWKTFCEESIINDVRKAWGNSVVETYRAGADRQLNADCEWLDDTCYDERGEIAAELHAAMRPKPQSLAGEALKDLAVLLDIVKRGGVFNPPDTIRLALERLRELEKGNE